MTLEEQIQKLTAERDRLIALIDKANSVGYGNAVTIQIERIQSERDAAKADLKAIGECVGGEPLAVRGLVESMDAAIKERDAALKACAEMRDASREFTDEIWEHVPEEQWRNPPVLRALERLQDARNSSDCGKGYHRDDEWKLVVKALERCIERLDNTHHSQTLKMAREALAHAERLTGKDK